MVDVCICICTRNMKANPLKIVGVQVPLKASNVGKGDEMRGNPADHLQNIFRPKYNRE